MGEVDEEFLRERIMLGVWLLFQTFVIAVEDPEIIINNDITKANIAWTKEFPITNTTNWEWLEQGEFARGSVVPQEPKIGEVVLAGSGIFENPENPDGIYGCKEEDYATDYAGKIAFI